MACRKVRAVRGIDQWAYTHRSPTTSAGEFDVLGVEGQAEVEALGEIESDGAAGFEFSERFDAFRQRADVEVAYDVDERAEEPDLLRAGGVEIADERGVELQEVGWRLDEFHEPRATCAEVVV